VKAIYFLPCCSLKILPYQPFNFIKIREFEEFEGEHFVEGKPIFESAAEIAFRYIFLIQFVTF
jgi:hypothetical protein